MPVLMYLKTNMKRIKQASSNKVYNMTNTFSKFSPGLQYTKQQFFYARIGLGWGLLN